MDRVGKPFPWRKVLTPVDLSGNEAPSVLDGEELATEDYTVKEHTREGLPRGQGLFLLPFLFLTICPFLDCGTIPESTEPPTSEASGLCLLKIWLRSSVTKVLQDLCDFPSLFTDLY